MSFEWGRDPGFVLMIVGCIGVLTGIFQFLRVSFGFIPMNTTINIVVNSFMISFAFGFGSLLIHISHRMYSDNKRRKGV